MALLLYILQLYMSQTQTYLVVTTTLYNCLSSKEAERKRENKPLFIAFVILTFLFNTSGSFHLFL